MCIEATESTEHDLVAVAHLLSGRPESHQRDYLRMLYFSVVTITTLGFGDVVPITRLSRVLVTFEAFLGPVLIGFFLAAVGLRMGDAAARAAAGIDSTVAKVPN
jgi:hypothetical protein